MIGGLGGMLSFELRRGYEAAYWAIRCTQMCILAMSLGGVENLHNPPGFLGQPAQHRRSAARSRGFARADRDVVGAEDIEDIIGVLDTALV